MKDITTLPPPFLLNRFLGFQITFPGLKYSASFQLLVTYDKKGCRRRRRQRCYCPFSFTAHGTDDYYCEARQGKARQGQGRLKATAAVIATKKKNKTKMKRRGS